MAELAPDFVKSPILRRFTEVWCAARGPGESVPRKGAVDPVDIAKSGAMPYTWMVERESTGRYRYRVSGTEIDAVYDRPVTGRYADEVFQKETIATITSLWEEMLAHRLIFHSLGRLTASAQIDVPGERMSFPLVDDEGVPRYIIGVTEYMYDRTAISERVGPMGYEWVSRQTIAADSLGGSASTAA